MRFRVKRARAGRQSRQRRWQLDYTAFPAGSPLTVGDIYFKIYMKLYLGREIKAFFRGIWIRGYDPE
jgi:hypothetical protein